MDKNTFYFAVAAVICATIMVGSCSYNVASCVKEVSKTASAEQAKNACRQ
jgi:hypothetical protein